jgi:hypothetical protein
MPNTDPYNSSFTIPDRLHVDALSFDGDLLTISGGVRGSQARCPARPRAGSMATTPVRWPTCCGTGERIRLT